MAKSDSIADGECVSETRATTSLEFGRCSRGRSKHLGGGGQKIEGRGMGGERQVTVRGRKRDNKEDKDRRK